MNEKPRLSLISLVVFGVATSLLTVGGFFLLFAAYEADAWLFWTSERHLSQDTLFDVGRNAVTLAAALGVGVTLFFSYRKQQTAEHGQELAITAQELAMESQRIATKTLQLSLDKHDLEKVGDLRARYSRSAEQLGSDKSAVQLAGLHSLVSLADDWAALQKFDEQQVCISLLCSFIKDSARGRDASGAAAAVEIIKSRIHRDLAVGQGSWSGSTLILERADFGIELLNPSVHGGQLILRDCAWSEAGMITGLHVKSGIMALQGMFKSPWFLGARFEGGRLELTPSRIGETLSVTFASCSFLGSKVILSPEAGLPVHVDFVECHFVSGDVMMTILGARSSIRFSDCTFESPSVVKVRSRQATAPRLVINKCKFIKAATAMEENPAAAMASPAI